VGTYEPAIELLLLDCDHAPGLAAWRFYRLCRLQPELLSMPAASSDCPPASNIPESVVLLRGASKPSQLQVWFHNQWPSVPCSRAACTVRSSMHNNASGSIRCDWVRVCMFRPA
jgi:hypothetical protein